MPNFALNALRGLGTAGNLAAGAGARSRAQQQDFTNQYFGSQIAPMWTPMLQVMSESGARFRGDPGTSFQSPDQLPSTLFDPDQTSAVTGQAFDPNAALAGLRKQIKPSPLRQEADTYYAQKYPGMDQVL